MDYILVYDTEPLGTGRDELQDAIEEMLGGRGEVTGGGAGVGGWNIDIEVFDPRSLAAVVAELEAVLKGWPLSSHAILDINGTRRPLFQ